MSAQGRASVCRTTLAAGCPAQLNTDIYVRLHPDPSVGTANLMVPPELPTIADCQIGCHVELD